MRIFAIRDGSDRENKNLAYLFYYEREKYFYIELPDNADPWEVPLLLSSLLKKGNYTIDSYWSKRWVQQRVVPPDRQNIGQILRDNKLDVYDEYKLLMLAKGRCAQDDYYLVGIDEQEIPIEVQRRFHTKVTDIVPLENYFMLVFFADGATKKCDLKTYFKSNEKFNVLLRMPEYFSDAWILPGGYGISWDENLSVPDADLYKMGQDVPLALSDFCSFVQRRVVNVAETAEILNCSRQNIDDLTKRGRLHPIKATGKNTLYLKSEILKRLWQ